MSKHRFVFCALTFALLSPAMVFLLKGEIIDIALSPSSLVSLGMQLAASIPVEVSASILMVLFSFLLGMMVYSRHWHSPVFFLIMLLPFFLSLACFAALTTFYSIGTIGFVYLSSFLAGCCAIRTIWSYNSEQAE